MQLTINKDSSYLPLFLSSISSMSLIKAFQGKNHFWRYVVTLIIVFAATQVGAIPFTILLFVKALESGQIDSN